MPAAASPPQLAVWLYGVLIARLRPAAGGLVQLTWADDAARTWGLGARTMSELLPIQHGGEQPHPRRVNAVLSGLLAEGNMREHLAFEVGVTSEDLFGMISFYGRDTAGALVFLADDGTRPEQVGSWEPASDTAIARRLAAAGRYAPDPAGANSLAGVQPKIVLRRAEGRWWRCLQGAPSTHIVKLGHSKDTELADVIDTEAACLALARTLELSNFDAYVTEFAGVRALVIARYDRRSTPTGDIARLHQEDTAQALGLDTTDLNRKVQRGKALPSLKAIAQVLRNSHTEPDALLALTTFNLAIGNSDAHAKNLALLRSANGGAQLAPAYDVAMHAHHPSFSNLFAMDVVGQSQMTGLTGRDLVEEGRSWPLPQVRARRLVRVTLERLKVALQEIDRGRHPGVSDVAWRTVQTRTEQLLRSID